MKYLMYNERISYNQMYHIEGINFILNPANFMSLDPTCAASTECISGEGCNSATVCGKYIYFISVLQYMS